MRSIRMCANSAMGIGYTRSVQPVRRRIEVAATGNVVLFYLNPHNPDRFGFCRLVGGVQHLCYAVADILQ